MSTLKLFKTDLYKRIGGLGVFRNRIVLDVGCGDGEDANAISRYAKRVVGIDIAAHVYWKRKNKNVKLVVGDANNLPFPDKSFNGIFLKDVLHHVSNPEKVMKEIKRVAKPDAVIIIIEGNRYNPLFYVHMTKLGGHEHLTQNNFKHLIAKYFSEAKFVHFESHFIPYINETVFRVIIKVEHFIDKMPSLKKFLSYNAAIKNEG